MRILEACRKEVSTQQLPLRDHPLVVADGSSCISTTDNDIYISRSESGLDRWKYKKKFAEISNRCVGVGAFHHSMGSKSGLSHRLACIIVVLALPMPGLEIRGLLPLFTGHRELIGLALICTAERARNVARCAV